MPVNLSHRSRSLNRASNARRAGASNRLMASPGAGDRYEREFKKAAVWPFPLGFNHSIVLVEGVVEVLRGRVGRTAAGLLIERDST